MERSESVLIDVHAIAIRIGRFLKCRGVEPELSMSNLVGRIYRYIRLRKSSPWYMISLPTSQPYRPEGWKDKEEEIWMDWIHCHCTLDDWSAEVMEPVFGSDIRLWEAQMDGWREELLQFMPWWIRRSPSIVEACDPTPLNPEVEDDQTPKIDPYLLDHGSMKQKRVAMKSSMEYES